VKFSKERPTVVDVTVRGLTGNQVLLRVEAAQTCYSNIDQVLRNDERTPASNATIVGHGGVGVVEAIGPQVISTRVGDRVILNLHAACGRCWNCLHMRSDKCRSGQAAPVPLGTLSNGAEVFGRTGAMSELAITGEEMVTPIFTSISGPEIAMLTCVGGCGLGMTMTNAPVEVASDVVIFGAGPVGLSAVMGAKVKGASRIIVGGSQSVSASAPMNTNTASVSARRCESAGMVKPCRVTAFEKATPARADWSEPPVRTRVPPPNAELFPTAMVPAESVVLPV